MTIPPVVPSLPQIDPKLWRKRSPGLIVNTCAKVAVGYVLMYYLT